MKEEELVKLIHSASMNINSETAEKIADSYIHYKYIEMFVGCGTLILFLIFIFALIYFLLKKGI